MGSCLGTNSAAPPPKTPTSGASKSPPPVYEETVKQVLSETPAAAPKHPIPTFHYRETMPHQNKNAFNGAGLKREKAAEVSPARKSDAASPGRAKPGRGRSRLPVTQSGSGSSKSPVKTGFQPGRVEYGSGDRIRKGKEEERMPPTNIELLESSLVSFECFIFL
ncbi:hypothetical protein SASPL_154160 [Salvia splendens]|uniref:Uncharacterized protein n=1 Tax=Salvia splendens TaxID=180675 RepID=A0A8X8VZJ4_SALSN|nr:hypothetical protein SASPL_154160 [Salvia splendens]